MADYLAKKQIPFREAHAIVGQAVFYCLERNKALEDLTLEEFRQFSPVFEEDIYKAISLEECVVKRNVIGTVNALSCADMAMAGIISRIPPDQVIDAMKEVGDKMDSSLRETALGGLAQSIEGLKVTEQFEQNQTT